MAAIDFCDLSIEQEEYLVELLCTRGACTVDWLARELDDACRARAASPDPMDSDELGPSVALVARSASER